MGVDVFSINLDKPSRQYSPGENITGKVFLRVSGEETTTAYTHWTEQESHQESYHSIGHHSIGHHSIGHSHRHRTVYETVHYSATEVFFDFAVRLFGDGGNRYRIPFGDNVFPFTFQVPTRALPVTCSFEDGHVMYGFEGRVKKPWYQFDPKTEILPVVIFTFTDLNISPGAGNPMQVADSRTFGCCCPSQPCFLQSFTPRLGFCPGDLIPFSVEINNQSNRILFNVTATLTQMWTLFADGRRGRHMHTHPLALQAAGRQAVNPGELTKWDVSFTIPITVSPSPNPLACHIVKMEYVIIVTAATEGCCGDNNFSVSHPIIIGNVPLKVPVVAGPQVPAYNEKGGSA